ncbi:MAG: phage protein Gp36 family protein [Odoribacter sp.]
MFITKKDFKMAIREYELDEITAKDDTLVEIAISTAIGEMKPYLFRYDVDKIFSAEGDKRESLLVRFAVDIAVFELVSIARPDQDLENRRALYKRAIDWLKQVRDDSLPTGLPEVRGDTDESGNPIGDVMSGSQPQRNNYF